MLTRSILARIIVTLVLAFPLLLPMRLLAAEADVTTSASEANKFVIKKLGVSINALSRLVSASPNSFVPKEYLERDGSWKPIKDLEQAGYVEIRITRGLPDGSESSREFVSLIPTMKGKTVLLELLKE